MKTLPKLSEYVKKQCGKCATVPRLFNIENYANFITQPLNLSHFVPAIQINGEWVVLQEPNASQEKYNNYNIVQAIFDDKLYYNDLKQYQTALENVVFKGFALDKYKRPTKGKYVVDFGEEIRLCTETWNVKIKNLEDLIPYNLELNNHIIEKYKL